MKVLDGLKMANQQIQDLADGSLPTDAVTLQQMQAYVKGLDWKASVRAASTTNVAVSSPGGSMDGVSLATGDRVLLKNQSAASENGIYQFNGGASPLTRTTDADSSTNLTAGTAVLVAEGTTLADTAWVLTTDDPITVGSTNLAFVQFGGGISYVAGNGIDITGTTVSVKPVSGGGISVVAGGVQIDFTKATGKFSQSIGNGSATSFNITHGLATTDVLVAVKDTASGEVRLISWTVVDANTVSVTFPSAPTSSQYRVTVHG